MKIFCLIISLAAFGFSCASAPQTANVNSDNSARIVASSRSQTANVNSAAPASNSASKGNPMERAIDTSAFDADIKKAEATLKVQANNANAKKSLANAYYARADALTVAAQYRAALGDFRRVLKYDADNQDAKDWIARITGIFQSLNREAPKEGEEPAPLPFNKTT